MTSYDLSICIATRNRHEYLKLTMNHLLEQSMGRVEIVVVDGASTDATGELMTNICKHDSSVNYIRSTKNGGVDQDFDTAVECSSGQYCWLMSDDDQLLPGALDQILEIIKAGHALIILNSQVRDRYLNVVLENRRSVIKRDRIYSFDEFDRIFRDLVDYMSFIGCVIIRRNIWVGRKRDLYFGTQFVHIGVIFQEPLPGSTLFVSEPGILIRYGVASWGARGFEIWMFRWPELIWSFTSLSDEVKSKICPPCPWKKLHKLFSFRAKGAYSIKEYSTWIKPRAHSRSRRALSWLIALIPGELANFVMISFYRLLCPNDKLQISDLKNSRFYFLRHVRKA